MIIIAAIIATILFVNIYIGLVIAVVFVICESIGIYKLIKNINLARKIEEEDYPNDDYFATDDDFFDDIDNSDY
jgi:hypothetical protein